MTVANGNLVSFVTGTSDTPVCECDYENETVEHLLVCDKSRRSSSSSSSSSIIVRALSRITTIPVTV